MSLQQHIFCTRSDLADGLKRLASRELKYVLISGVHSTPDFVTFRSLEEYGELANHPSRVRTLGHCFLIMEASAKISPRRVTQIRGGTRYFLDQITTPDSVVFWPGGVHMDFCLVAGSVGTNGATTKAIELYQEFTDKMLCNFSTVAGYKVGPAALDLMASGYRLVTRSTDEPLEHDLNFLKDWNGI